jgi:hypothetical protein
MTGMRRLSKSLLAACVAVAGCAMTVPSAYASFGFESFEASFNQAPPVGAAPGTPGPLDFQAGSHPYQFTAKIAMSTTTNSENETVPDGDMKNIEIELPRGFAGNPAAVPRCPLVDLNSGESLGDGLCPADTQIGTVKLEGPSVNLERPVDNLVPPPGIAGQFGFVVLGPVVMDFEFRSGGAEGVTVTISELSNLFPLTKLSLTLWGVPADSGHNQLRGECFKTGYNCPSGAAVEPFLTMPPSCSEPLTTTVVINSWENPGVSIEKSSTADGADGDPAGLSGCDMLHFNPTITVQPESSVADSPSGLSLNMSIPYNSNPEGVAEADMKNIAIAFPAGMSIDPAAAAGLTGCSPSEFGLGEASQPACPKSSKIGALEIETPVVGGALGGAIYLAQPPPGLFGGRMGVYLVAEGDGLLIKLSGELSAQLESGQLTLTLNNMPELPLSDVRFDLFGGPRATLAAPPMCGTFTTTSVLTPYSAPESGAPVTPSSSFAVDENCGGGFAPSFAAGATSSLAGQGTGFVLQAARADGQQYIQSLTTALPAGLMANLSTIPLCGEAEAAAGTCPQSSEMGTATIAAGAGLDPEYLGGRVYLTGPYGGAPYGLSIVIPGSVGPFDLGTVVVRGRIAVDVADARLTIATNPFPTVLEGIPLRMKNLNLDIDRPGLMINPTECTPQAIGGTVNSTAGAGAAVSAPFRLSGCSTLLFAPKLAAATPAGASSRGDGAGFDVKVTSPPGAHANLASLTVDLPKPLKPRLTAVQRACTAATFAVNPGACPPGSVVGKATVDTPIQSSPLTGPVYLVFYRGVKYPKLVMVLQGGGMEIQLTGALNVGKGISSTAFGSLPDIPMSLFELDLSKGGNSVLGATENLCSKRRTMPYVTVGQNGARTQGDVGITVAGCPAPARATRSSGRARRKRPPASSSARAGRRR